MTALEKRLRITGALFGWFALVAQYYLVIINPAATRIEQTIRFFSFYTILTNLLVALYFTVGLINKKGKSLPFFKRGGSLTAVTLYITVVGLVYQIALRHVWEPQGLQRVVDELLHTVIPALVILFWYLFEDKSSLNWRAIPRWLIYPACYLASVLIRGVMSGWYPYYFINAFEMSPLQLMVNIMILLGVFVVIAVGFVGWGIGLSRRGTTV